MPKKALDRLKRLNRKHLIIAGVMGAAIVVLLIVQLLSPERSIRAYCKEYEKQLATFSRENVKYRAGIFTSDTLSGSP